jgi:glucokinase
MISLAVDFGGTRIKLGIVEDGRAVAVEAISAESDQPLATRLAGVAQSLEKLCAAQQVKLSHCAGISFAYPSIIDCRAARILDHFGKFGDARDLDLRQWAREQFALPLVIDNDARMALIGEWQFGAGRGSDNCLMITLGTGIGVAAVMEGKVLRGAHGQAAILGGHTTMEINGYDCVCGNVGCVEGMASTTSVSRLARQRSDFATSALANEAVVDYAAIFRCAAAGDACAVTLRDDSLKIWSALAVNLIHLFDPDRIILGGGVMRSAEFILPFIRSYVARHAHTPWGKVEVVASELGDNAALVAGEWLLKESREEVKAT